jgi:hypothetical protein
MYKWLVQNELCGSNKAITAFLMVMPDGNWLQEERLNHNQDKIQLLKEVSFEILQRI